MEGGGCLYFGLRPSLFLLSENHVIFSVGLRPRYFFGQSESKLFFFCCFLIAI